MLGVLIVEGEAVNGQTICQSMVDLLDHMSAMNLQKIIKTCFL